MYSCVSAYVQAIGDRKWVGVLNFQHMDCHKVKGGDGDW